MARVDMPGHLFRAQAQEHPSGYPHRWGLTSIALCAERPSQFAVTDGDLDPESSEQLQESSVSCEDDRDLLSLGAAIDANAPGNATLQLIVAADDDGGVKATEQYPTPYLWGDVLARAVCAEVEWE